MSWTRSMSGRVEHVVRRDREELLGARPHRERGGLGVRQVRVQS
jgi:hypothetical protein